VLREDVEIALRRARVCRSRVWRGVLAVTGSKQALLVALFGGVLFGAVLALPHAGDDQETFRTVVGVRHSGAPESPRPSRTMIATYYDYSLAGNVTASGEPLDPEEYAAAHRTLPLGTRLLVSYRGESVRVIVNDRGPYVAGYDIDISLAAAREIGLIGPGTAPVRVTVL
jgi:rare lipoprotein A